jgi:hypothetical protein
MVRDAEAFAEEDKKRREAAEAKNNAESLVHTTEKQLEEHGSKIDAGLKSEIEAAVAETKTAIEGGDVADMNAKTQALTDKAMKMGQAIYEKEQAAAASPGAEAPKDAEDVVDASPSTCVPTSNRRYPAGARLLVLHEAACSDAVVEDWVGPIGVLSTALGPIPLLATAQACMCSPRRHVPA